MKLLLAIEDSKFSEAATQAVLKYFRPQECQVCVLHIVEPLLLMPQFREGDIKAILDAEKQLAKDGKDLVAKAEETLRAAGFKTQSLVREGDHRTNIVDYAAEWKSDMIVLGSHGRRGLDRFLLGSVADYVSRHARCSVLIVRIPRAA